MLQSFVQTNRLVTHHRGKKIQEKIGIHHKSLKEE